MDQINIIPNEILKIIPKFDGNTRMLKLFIKKCEYVIAAFKGDNNVAQDVYVFHAITSRLIGKAAQLLGEREDIDNWDDLKDVLAQYFGDQRSEDCIAIELENLKIHIGESYHDFCNRVRYVRSILFSKVNLIENPTIREAKITNYNHTAFNVFLYNLPKDIVQIVRLKECTTIEEALKVVMEEDNFLQQYNSRNNRNQNFYQPFAQPAQNLQPLPLKPIFSQNNSGLFGSQPSMGFNSNSIQSNTSFGTTSQGQGLFGNQNKGQEGFKSGLANQGQGSVFGQPPKQQTLTFGAPQPSVFGPLNKQQGFTVNKTAPQDQSFKYRFGIPYQHPKPTNQIENDVSLSAVFPQAKPDGDGGQLK